MFHKTFTSNKNWVAPLLFCFFCQCQNFEPFNTLMNNIAVIQRKKTRIYEKHLYFNIDIDIENTKIYDGLFHYFNALDVNKQSIQWTFASSLLYNGSFMLFEYWKDWKLLLSYNVHSPSDPRDPFWKWYLFSWRGNRMHLH